GDGGGAPAVAGSVRSGVVHPQEDTTMRSRTLALLLAALALALLSLTPGLMAGGKGEKKGDIIKTHVYEGEIVKVDAKHHHFTIKGKRLFEKAGDKGVGEGAEQKGREKAVKIRVVKKSTGDHRFRFCCEPETEVTGLDGKKLTCKSLKDGRHVIVSAKGHCPEDKGK